MSIDGSEEVERWRCLGYELYDLLARIHLQLRFSKPIGPEYVEQIKQAMGNWDVASMPYLAADDPELANDLIEDGWLTAEDVQSFIDSEARIN